MANWSYFKIGLFVITATALAVVGVVVLGVGTLFQKQVLVETYIDESVQGLDIGSPVKFRGVQVGRVEQITLTSVEYPTRRRYVLVRAGLEPSMFEYPLVDVTGPGFVAEIEKGLRVRLAAQGLTGVAYLEADYLDPNRYPPLPIDWQPAYPYIPSARSTITRLTESIDSILRKLEAIDVERLTEVMENSLIAVTKFTEGANLEKIGPQINAILAEFAQTNRQLKTLVTGPELKATLADAAAAARTARRIVEQAEAPLGQVLADLPETSKKIQEVVATLETASAELPESAGHLKQALRRLDRFVATQQQDLESVVRNMRSISENVREITGDARSYPGQILFGAQPPPAKSLER
ncbi:MAG TPA: MlaD family protein [Candidatus Eisenbacteria bacterium]|nr:MlaD family protein [Candidatus Eisenbacteria bacterium]